MNEETQDLYALLRDHLRVADTPLTYHDLYDVPEIRAVAPSANRVPDGRKFALNGSASKMSR